ncbi:hypothetical protein Kpol_401p6 [Vanderwaltozyma polyspora DSM 70294]|uniref:Uncharacterized protein n=1 Tax=Vanderwaltozyma polyspora (strain ATCC 22028 / DSM 70294 / BCRC 21397 / CBS 2163 / NBRC 10782 / NRRL Y-8283 / UCD 57-17) TaxID=436907 RepID=A7TRA5_VANPO|nr:uncharacterized protein Kpol_401p6 [Vanderwaltozyma polyspora DSM 70294]EDO15201.1 hypothetical protein Kpol_401p6 [Vanderwaltozyma polyspora DSM 70294]
MSIDRSTSRTPLRKSVYPLRMERIPLGSDYKASQISTQDTEINKEGDINESVKHRMSSYESDEDFQFKRHKNKHINGVPSLGERLDNFQDIKKAKWVENFNSSAVNLPEQVKSNDTEEVGYDNRNDIQMKTSPPPHLQQSQLHSQPQHPSYIPYMYYYPVPTPGHPMMQFPNSPIVQSQMDPSQYGNNSISMMPNSSMQPFYASQQPQNHTGVPGQGEIPQLLPPPLVYPYNFMQPSQNPYMQKIKDRRKSMAAQRGRRVSMLSMYDENIGIISPHKDVPEEDFFRHIGDGSFGKGLQIRQLFSWCAIRSLRKMETEPNFRQESLSVPSDSRDEDSYLNPKKIALKIISEFVNDLRKDKIDIDWEAEISLDDDDDDDTGNANADDTELRQLFEEDEDDTDYIAKPKKNKPKRKTKSQLPKMKIPNIKNLENETNLKLLEENIKKLKSEISDWAIVLNNQSPHSEWEDLCKEYTFEPEVEFQDTEATTDNLENELNIQMDKLNLHSHLLGSTSTALSKLNNKKRNMLAQVLSSKVKTSKQQVNSKLLLNELSKSLLSKE